MHTHAVLLAALSILSFSLNWNAHAGESRLSMDPSADLSALARTGRASVQVSHRGRTYTVDASALLPVNATRFFQVAMDFDRQARMGLPNTVESHTVQKSAGRKVGWIHYSAIGADSKHYLEARIHEALGNGAMGAAWELIPGRPEWRYADAPAFDQLDGSLYVQPLPNSGTPELVYVRYFIQATIQTVLPEFLISRFVEGQFRQSVGRGLEIIRVNAK